MRKSYRLRNSFRAIAAALAFVVLYAAILPAGTALAESSGGTSSIGKCPDKFPDLIGDVCWKNLFPIKIGGITIMSDSDSQDNMDYNYNPDDSNPTGLGDIAGNPLCSCGSFPNIKLGILLSWWNPETVIETVRRPYCFPFMFGMDMGDIKGLWGAAGSKNMAGDGKLVFWNAHEYHFPLLYLLQLIGILNNCSDEIESFDLLGASEMSPTWNDDSLSFAVNFDAAVFANPIAQALCATDCTAATAGWPINAEFWCAGCWGSMYPFTGNTGSGSAVEDSLLITARVLALSDREPGLFPPETITSGSGAQCLPHTVPPFIKKSQYKYSMLYPVPMTQGMCGFPLGRDTMISTAEYRTIPETGEDYGWMIWKKHDCCVLY